MQVTYAAEYYWGTVWVILGYTYATFMSGAKIGYIMNAWFSKEKK
jgi:hypothetical protein